MAVTNISDVITPEIFDPYVTLQIIEKSSIIKSGIAAQDPRMVAFLNGGGQTINLPFWNQLVMSDEANISTDVAGDTSTPKEFTAGKNIAIRQGLNQSWSAMDIASTFAGSDPMMALANQVATYWDMRAQARMVNSLVGIIVDNVANDSGDMVNDIYAASGPTDANRFSAEASIDTWATLGDRWEDVTAISMHSVVFAHLQKLQLIDYIRESDNSPKIATYKGLRLIINDENYVNTGGLAKYYTFFLGAGSIAFANAPAEVPSELERTPAAGDGGGQETFFSRQQFVIHPQGFQVLTGGVASQSPTMAELLLAAAWDRQVTRKRVKIACLIHNG